MSILMDDAIVKKSFIPDPNLANVKGTLSLTSKIPKAA